MPAKEKKTQKEKKPRIEKKITLGRDRDGKLVRRSIYAKTTAELEKKIFAARQQYLSENAAPSDDMAFGAFARQWLRTEKQHAAINTRAMYSNVIEKHLIPDLGDLYFSEISQADLQGVINYNFEKPETCNKIKLTLRQLYAAAVDLEMDIRRGVNIKKLILPKREKNEKRPLTEPEKLALFSADLDERERVFVLILYYCGLRREECLALDCSRIDFKEKLLHVRQALVFDENAPKIERPKNIYSIRSVPIPAAFLPVLKAYTKDKSGLLFTMSDGSPLTKSSFRRMWDRIKSALAAETPDAETLTPHIFRHNYATMLFYSEVSIKKAAQLLGHADTTMLMRVYAHLNEMKENAAEKLDRVFAADL